MTILETFFLSIVWHTPCNYIDVQDGKFMTFSKWFLVLSWILSSRKIEVSSNAVSVQLLSWWEIIPLSANNQLFVKESRTLNSTWVLPHDSSFIIRSILKIGECFSFKLFDISLATILYNHCKVPLSSSRNRSRRWETSLPKNAKSRVKRRPNFFLESSGQISLIDLQSTMSTNRFVWSLKNWRL